jgi:FkbM family methyltransferase
LSRFFIRNIKKGDVVLDAGANSGFYSVLSSFLVGKEGSVHAFEPTPEIFQMLRKNTRELSNIFTVRVALSDAPGEADFHLHPIHAVANSLVILPEHQGKTINVQVTTLDEYCNKNNVCPSFIKLDVEGAESKVIKGSAKTLARCAPVISLEILNQSSGADFQAATELVGYGYTPHRLKSNGDIEKISMEEVVASTTGEVNEFHNYIFKKLI